MLRKERNNKNNALVTQRREPEHCYFDFNYILDKDEEQVADHTTHDTDDKTSLGHIGS